ncbi:MAG: hypothetical protein WB785_20110 [Mycobacterium sp.]|uniref:hypothetical protein n=1 Tax=Mycobacterium sp. TaxID=1785 RepID=UPI003C4403E9
MTRARSSSARGRVAKIAVAGVLIGIPIAAVSGPAYAAPAGTPTVLPAPLPADPPPNPPEPPPHHQAPPAPVYTETEDWWGYGDSGGGGGGG